MTIWTTIYNILRDLSFIENTKDLYAFAVVTACEQLEFGRAFLFIEHNGKLVMVSMHDKSNPDLARISLTILQQYPLKISLQTPETMAFTMGEPILVEDVLSLQQPTFHDFVGYTKIISYIIQPIRSKNHIAGILILDYKTNQAVTPEDMERSRWYAAAIGAALETLTNRDAIEHKIKEKIYALRKSTSSMDSLMTKLKESNRLKSEFLANMSHELRTPLNSIIGFSKVILKGIDGEINETQRTDLQAIHSSGLHLLHLINDILDFSKIEAGKMELVQEDVTLREIITEAVNSMEGLCKEKHIEMKVELGESLPRILVDKIRIRQILINLISNAIKFTEQGYVTISAAASSDEVVVVVSDTGKGIDDKNLAKVFDAFYQIDGSTSRKAGGTGLGLAISKKFVELHGGRIWAKSTLGIGSSFHFTIPLRK
jgi:signal transduction histidine kinase